MSDSTLAAPLASFEGRLPSRPAWFPAVLARARRRRWHEVAGARIEALSWGEIGRPGLLPMHCDQPLIFVSAVRALLQVRPPAG